MNLLCIRVNLNSGCSFICFARFYSTYGFVNVIISCYEVSEFCSKVLFHSQCLLFYVNVECFIGPEIWIVSLQ